MRRFEGKVVMVTGAGSGIGRATAVRFASEGARVSASDINAEGLAETMTMLDGAGHHSQLLDVAQAGACREAVAATVAACGRLDVLCNIAGFAGAYHLHEVTEEFWQRMLAVNLTGTFLCTREALGEMTKRGSGRIVNVASTAGLVGYGYVSAYCAAKHGVIGLTRAAALEIAKTGVTVNAVCPGYTETDIVQDAVANIVKKTGKTEAEARAALVARNPQGRMIQPDEVAAAVLWLCLPSSGSITGQAITVAGGEVMG